MLKKTLLFLVFLAGCQDPLVPPNSHDAAFCDTAQKTLLSLECKDSRDRLLGGPNKTGEEYSVVCKRNIENNVAMYAECTSKITDCKGVDSCFRK